MNERSSISKHIDLLFHGWKTSIACLWLGMLISFLLFGFWWPYWRIADQDLILAYQGLLFADGLPQEYFDHPGYLSYLALGSWYDLLHRLGILPVHALSELPSASDVAAFDAAWQRLVASGRALSLVFAGIFVWVFATLVRRLIGDWRLAALAGVLLAYSSGVAMHLREMRTELVSAGLATTALLLVLIAARDERSRWRLVFLILAGLCSTLAVVAKVQAIFPALAVPVVALAFGHRNVCGTAPRLGSRRMWGWAVLLVALALLAGLPAMGLLARGMAEIGSTTIGYRAVGASLSGIYQPLMALWVIAAMVAYAALWRVPLADALAAMAAIALGVALGLLSLHIRYGAQNVIAVANPIQHMFAFVAKGVPELAKEPQVLSGALVMMLTKGVGQALAMHSFVLRPSHRPALLIEWIAIAGAISSWRGGDRRLPLQIALLLLVVWGLDAVFTLRGLKLEYFVYTDPLLILAAALVAARFPQLATSARVQKVALGALAFYIAWAHAEPVKATLSRADTREACDWLPRHLKRVERFPFCRSSTSEPNRGK